MSEEMIEADSGEGFGLPVGELQGHDELSDDAMSEDELWAASQAELDAARAVEERAARGEPPVTVPKPTAGTETTTVVVETTTTASTAETTGIDVISSEFNARFYDGAVLLTFAELAELEKVAPRRLQEWTDQKNPISSERLRERRVHLEKFRAANAAGTPVVEDAGRDPVEDRVDVRERFPLLDLAALVDPNRPPRRYLLDGVIPEGEQVSLVAPAGVGKSLQVEALCIAIVRGHATFMGLAIDFPAERRVLVIDMENSEDDLAERFVSLGVTPENVAGLSERLLILHMPRLRGLDTEQGAQELRLALDGYGIGAGDLLVLDSTQRVTEGDENANDTMRRLYNLTSIELKRRGITVVRTDNTGWSQDRERGASAKRDDVGFSWLLVPDDGDAELFTLEPTKRRSKGSSETITFRRWTDDAGLLHFDRARSARATAFGDAMRATRDLLDRLGIPLDMGHGKVWAAVQAEKTRASSEREDFPEGITQRVVRAVHDERRQVARAVADRADELPPADIPGDVE